MLAGENRRLQALRSGQGLGTADRNGLGFEGGVGGELKGDGATFVVELEIEKAGAYAAGERTAGARVVEVSLAGGVVYADRSGVVVVDGGRFREVDDMPCVVAFFDIGKAPGEDIAATCVGHVLDAMPAAGRG